MRAIHALASFVLAACAQAGVGLDGGTGTSATLVIEASGNGSGKVTSSPAGITCGATCSARFELGTPVTLSAAPDADATFVGWSGGGCSGTGECVIDVTADVTVQALFARSNSVIVTLAGNGAGTVSSVPSGIACPGDCSEVFMPGQSVTLTATPSAGSGFVGWSGGCSGTGPCTVLVGAAVGLTATFTQQAILSVNKTGTGAGTVTSTPAAIDCGPTCSAMVATGAMVTFTATPSAGSTFTGWSGAGCAGTGTCVVTVAAATAVSASFTLATHALTVSKTGNGTGTVTSTPAGISCGATCSAMFAHGTSITLTASPTSGHVFTGWSGGGCTGTGPCTVSLMAATSVTATFTVFTCGSTTGVMSCTNGAIPELDLGQISSSACRTQCQAAMPNAGMTSGCWLVALNNICYCRSGQLFLGGTRPGGSCP